MSATPERPRTDVDHTASNHSWLRDLVPIERGLLRTVVDLVLRPGRLTARWIADRAEAVMTPVQIYLACAALGLGTTALFGEANTGALYVFGGGVFGKVERWGGWLAFALTVPVLATCLRAMYAGLPLRFRDHLAFAFHFQAFVFLCIALESVALVLLPDGSPAHTAASFFFFLIAAIYYMIAQIDAYRRPAGDAILRGLGASVLYLAVFVAAAFALASTTGFRL